ncbi:class I SAM-dependent methyltransferase [Phyllobacterium salinisoli]|uniref:Class I SAM-dependent methyltransferase n=1 Tax=Phyllobacterium salinisoli TaxID=1899321 RepID=A0A368K0D7_9HYPH|nr:class I SAM-dependent methyltransferase [Phyllobacterium salinisoli]RCS21882.1 class I SAM-dependent methyltransferase [Phyllobacterium salinisoli]
MDGSSNGSNFGLRDEIKAYWSQRAATFDLSPGHAIFSEEERSAWYRLITRHLGDGKGRTALDLASGTGVISMLMDDIGFDVTGMDWAEPMLERARAKAKAENRKIAFRLGDAENTMEPDNHYDVITNRHLVWTLVNPEAAFAEWLRVLKPGGSVLIVDGDFVNVTFFEKLIQKLASLSQRLGFAHPQPGQFSQQMAEVHRSILSRVHFSGGARAEAVADLLRKAGFQNVTIDKDMRQIHRAQARHMGLWKGMARIVQHRYAIKATKGA